MTTDRAPNPVDIHVGTLIRNRRKQLGISQERLAHELGLTFQQVQKYERAANRVSASKLWHTAQVLQTDIGYFFDGLEGEVSADAPGAPPNVVKALVEPYIADIAMILLTLPVEHRRIIRDVAEAISKGPTPTEPTKPAVAPPMMLGNYPGDPKQGITDLSVAPIGSEIYFKFGTFNGPKIADGMARKIAGSGWYEIATDQSGTKIKKIAEPKS